MATLILICGLPGSGKTTKAKQLEVERCALRLTPDEWIRPLYGSHPTPEVLDAARDPVESLMWLVAARALTLNVNVVLDFGFWSQSEREDFRGRASALGAGSELCFLDVPEEALLRRLAARNAASPPDTFHVSEAKLTEWSRVFEPPTEAELTPRNPPDRPPGTSGPSVGVPV
jgi:predicted kinase